MDAADTLTFRVCFLPFWRYGRVVIRRAQIAINGDDLQSEITGEYNMEIKVNPNMWKSSRSEPNMTSIPGGLNQIES